MASSPDGSACTLRVPQQVFRSVVLLFGCAVFFVPLSFSAVEAWTAGRHGLALGIGLPAACFGFGSLVCALMLRTRIRIDSEGMTRYDTWGSDWVGWSEITGWQVESSTWTSTIQVRLGEDEEPLRILRYFAWQRRSPFATVPAPGRRTDTKPNGSVPDEVHRVYDTVVAAWQRYR